MAKAKVKAIHIEPEYCKGCGYCIAKCPKRVLGRAQEMTKKGYFPPCVKELVRCTVCRTCENICPDFAIYVEESDHSGS